MTNKQADKETKTINLTVPIVFILALAAAFLLGLSWKQIKSQNKPTAELKIEKKGNPTAGTAKKPTVLSGQALTQIESGGAAVKGKKDAPITIVEFSDYECPFCKRYVDQTYAKLWQDYGSKIRYIFHDFPLGFHKHAQKMAEAARCAGSQDKYWQMHDMLFAKHDEWVEKSSVDASLTAYAKKLGLNKAKFNQCLSSGKYKQAVKDDAALGQKVGVSGTPTFFINGKKLVGAQPFSAFKAIIDQQLSASK